MKIVMATNILELSEQEIVRRGSLDEMRRRGIDPYPAAEFTVTGHTKEIKETFNDDAPRREVSMKKDGRAHVGLPNTCYRLESMLHAKVDIKSKIGVGTTVTVRIPK